MEKQENKYEGLYIIGYGLGGGFGGAINFEVIQVDNQEQADNFAWENACEEYESYAGMHGLRSVEDIMQEDEIEFSEVQIKYLESKGINFNDLKTK